MNRFLQTFALVVVGIFMAGTALGQTYTATPSAGTSFRNVPKSPSGTIAGNGCSYTYTGGYFAMRVVEINGRSVKFEIQFSDDNGNGVASPLTGDFYIKEASTNYSPTLVCGTSYGSMTFSQGNASCLMTIDLNIPNGGTRYYCGVFISSSTRFYTNTIKIESRALRPDITTENATPIADGAYVYGKVTPYGQSTNCWVEYGISSGNLNNRTPEIYEASGSGTYDVTRQLTGLQPGTTYYYRLVARNSAGTSYGSTLSFTTSRPWTPPTITLNDATDVTQNSATLSAVVNPRGHMTVVGFEYGSSASNLNLRTDGENIGSGTTSISVTAALSLLPSNTTYYYRLKAASTDGSNNIQTTYSEIKSFRTGAISQPTTPSNPTPANGATGVATSTTLSWMSTGNSYDLYYSENANFSPNVLLTGNGQSRTLTNLRAGTTYYWKLKTYNSSGQQSDWSPVWSFTTKSNQNAGGCDLSDIPASSAYYAPTDFLCQRTVLSGTSDDGSVNVNLPLKRAHLAKIVFRGLYLLKGRTVPQNVPTDNYPTIYSDLSVRNSTNEYYYQAARALLYLDYGDGVSPFDRNRLSFEPQANISRLHVLKVLLEAFNIKPDVAGTNNPFPADTEATALMTSNPHKFGYIRRAVQLGIISTPSGGQNTMFRPNDDCLRGEAFIMLARIMQKIEANEIADPNPSSSSYFEPLNITLRTLALGIDFSMGNFNHYSKTSFTIDGVVPLQFSHEYNSYNTTLPEVFYGARTVNGRDEIYRPLGAGWSHNYHSYISLIGTGSDARAIVHWGGGNIHVYKSNGTQFVAESMGVFDSFTLSNSEVIIKTKSQIEYRFSSQGATGGALVLYLSSITDRNNNKLTVNYTNGTNGSKVISSVSDGRRQLSFAYMAGTNLLKSVTDPLNRTIRFTYTYNRATGEYMLRTFTDAKGQTTTYSYGDASKLSTSRLLTEIKLPKGNFIRNEYDANRRMNKTVTGVNGVPKTQTSVSISANYSNTISTTSQVQVHRNGNNSNFSYTYNSNNVATQLTGANGLHVSNTYGNSAMPQLPTAIQTNNTKVDNITYDERGNVKSVTIRANDGSASITRRMTYNSTNDLISSTDGMGSTTTYTYDSRGNLLSVNAPENTNTSFVVNDKGLPTAVTNPMGVRVEYGYNEFGNLTQTRLPALGLTTTMEYDVASRPVAQSDYMNNRHTYQYDANDNLIQEVNAMGHSTRYTYDANDNMTSITNAKGGVTTLQYDNATDWLTSMSFAGTTKQFEYNQDGTLSAFTKPDGTRLGHTYDELGRILSDGVNNYTYDNSHRLSSIVAGGKTLSFSYDGFNRVNRVVYQGSSSNTVSYSYDNNSNITTITYPNGRRVSYTYDRLNRMTSVTDWNGKTISYAYRPDSKVSRTTYPNGMYVEYDYDTAGRMTAKHTKRANGTVIAGYTYVLDNAGNILQQTAIEPFIPQPLPSESVSYSYNSGNRITRVGTVNFSFDANGNTTSRGSENYSWDALDRMTNAGSTSIEYDPIGLIRSYGNTNYTVDVMGIGNILSDSQTNANYVYGVGLEARIMPNGTTGYYVTDVRGSVVAIVDEAGQVTHKYQYDEFGKVLQSDEANFNPFRYVGKYGVLYNTDTHYYMRARHYDPTIGRFLSEDPIWSTNLYPYADNNPIMKIDPNGELAWETNIGNLWTNNRWRTSNQRLKKAIESLSKYSDAVQKDKIVSKLKELKESKYESFEFHRVSTIKSDFFQLMDTSKKAVSLYNTLANIDISDNKGKTIYIETVIEMIEYINKRYNSIFKNHIDPRATATATVNKILGDLYLGFDGSNDY